MKRFKHIFGVILAVILTNLTSKMIAQDFSGNYASDISVQNSRAFENATNWLDSVDISLLTCGPGQEVWSYYGHTALRIQDKVHDSDVAVNWGMFSFKQPFFVLRFVFGLTDYQIGIFPMSDFIAEYAAEGRWVRQQRILLSRQEKLKILRAIEENAKPENRTYRYNFFYDNCTTRAREMILTNIGYSTTNFKDANIQSSYREEIHKLNKQNHWARFGNDLLLGVYADADLERRTWEFLPDNLSRDFATEGRKDFVNESSVENGVNPVTSNGFITLVDSTFYVIPPVKQENVEQAGGMTPQKIAIGFALVIAVLTILEMYRKKNLWWVDTTLLVLTGLPGLILLAMVFSQHPTVQLNFQILILNPLNLIFVWKVTKKMRMGKQHWYFELYGWLLLLALFLQIWQTYAEGMSILACTLLLRNSIKSTMLELNSYGLQKYVHKKFHRNKRK